MTKTAPKPPKGVTTEVRRFWKSMQEAYCILDPAGLMHLGRASEALCELREAQAVVKAEGILVADKKGSKKRNPAVLVAEKASREFNASMKLLGLAVPVRTEEDEE